MNKKFMNVVLISLLCVSGNVQALEEGLALAVLVLSRFAGNNQQPFGTTEIVAGTTRTDTPLVPFRVSEQSLEQDPEQRLAACLGNQLTDANWFANHQLTASAAHFFASQPEKFSRASLMSRSGSERTELLRETQNLVLPKVLASHGNRTDLDGAISERTYDLYHATLACFTGAHREDLRHNKKHEKHKKKTRTRRQG